MSEKSIFIMTSATKAANLIQNVAARKGFAPTIFKGGVELVAALEQVSPELLVLDLGVEDIDGVELLEHLSQIRFRRPIILMCGIDQKLLASLHHIGKEKKLNIIADLQYPFSAEEVEQTIDSPSRNLSFIEAADIAQAIEEKHLVMHYQPKIEIRSRKWVGIEALIRWAPPFKSLIYPDAFIPVAEKSGLIIPLTTWTIQQVFEDAKRLTIEKDININMTINLSNKLLVDPFLPDEVFRMAKETQISPKSICFEITESATSNQPELVLEVLARLRLKGFSLSIDDFGTGYSSLFELQRLPFNELKVDKSFVLDLDHNSMNQAVVKSLVYLSHALGLKLVAEGVESPDIFSLLSELECDIAQGYFISKALPINELEEWYKHHIAKDLTWSSHPI